MLFRGRKREMNYETMLGVFHFCMAWHGGQWSREYRVMCRLFPKIINPRGREEYASVLAMPEYESGRAIYIALVKDMKEHRKRGVTSGYIDCCCCGDPMIVDDTDAEGGVTMCEACLKAECDPHAGCEIPTCEDCDTAVSLMNDGCWHTNCEADECERQRSEGSKSWQA